MKSEDEERQRFLHHLDKRLEKWWSDGTNLPDRSREFVRVVARRDLLKFHYPKGKVRNPRPMNGRERGYKRDVRLKLRNSVRDLAQFLCSAEPRVSESTRPWFTRKDLEGIYDLFSLTFIVSSLLDLFGEKYAAPLLDEIARFYEDRVKEIHLDEKFGEAGWESRRVPQKRVPERISRMSQLSGVDETEEAW